MDNFEESFNNFSEDEDNMFVRDMLLSEASDLQDCYRYIFDFNNQHPSEELTVILEYVRLAGVGLLAAYDIMDDKILDKSDVVDYNWVPNNK